MRRFGNADCPSIIFVAGFGDHGGMFEALEPTPLGDRYSLVAVDLPGTGQSPPLDESLTLANAAALVADVAEREAASVIVGHSVGSIVASLAAKRPGSPIQTVLSIEGNLTLADAYFSGSAADYSSASSFREAFLARLDEMAVGNPTLGRYRDQVALADPQSIWELGCDTHRWSVEHHPGEVLASSAPDVHYLLNPDNSPTDSLDWLADGGIQQHRLDGASHWKAVDQPGGMARRLLAALGDPVPT